MKRLLTLVAFFATLQASAQQVNPVPDYVFRNQMSVGRNAVTDTAAYFSIGPRYGATKGFMPPIVGDTATFSSGKRNGLLIFSVQKNKFLYWDSVRVQWSDMAGSSGAYIVAGDTSAMLAPYLRKSDTTAMLSPYYRSATASAALATKLNISDTASMLSPYYRSSTATAALATKLNISDTSTMLSPYARTATVNASLATKLNISDTSSMLGNYIRHAGYGLTKSGQSLLVDTLNISTRAWRQKGIDSVVSLIPAAGVGGSGTTNYVPKFTASSTIGNSQIFDDGTNVGIGTTSPSTALHINRSTGNARITSTATQLSSFADLSSTSRDASNNAVTYYSGSYGNAPLGEVGMSTNHALALVTNNTERLRIFANGRIGINTTTDAGYQLDVNGTLRSVNGANFATTSGNVGIGTASPTTGLNVQTGVNANIGNVSITSSDNDASGLSFKVKSSPTSSDSRSYMIHSNYSLAGTLEFLSSTTSTGNPTTPRMTITKEGNVGIGVTPSAHSGGGSIQLANGKVYSFGGQFGYVTANQYYNGSNDIYIQNGFATLYGQEQGVHKWSTAPSGIGGNVITFTQAMTLNTASELLVNTTTDAGDYKLQVAGNAYATGDLTLTGTGSILTRNTANTSGFDIGLLGGTSDANAYVYQRANAAMIFATNNTERGRINSAGEWIIDASGTDAGDYKLQVSGNIYNTGSAVLAVNSGSRLLVGNTSLPASGEVLQSLVSSGATFLEFQNTTTSSGATIGTSNGDFRIFTNTGALSAEVYTERMRLTSDGELLVNTTSDAGDYKLQVVGNARVGTGKLDIASNTTFGLGVARSGTSEVAGQIYNSNGILYLGAESSAGGQIFSGSSAYAAVIGSGANYPLQFAVNNTIRGGFNTGGELLINTTSDAGDYKLQVAGNIYASGSIVTGSSITPSALYVAGMTTGSGAVYHVGSRLTLANYNTNGTLEFEVNGGTYAMRIDSAGNVGINQTVPTEKLHVGGNIMTAAPSGGTAKPFKIGEAATVSPTSPNRTIRVEIDGTVYYLHAKTTND